MMSSTGTDTLHSHCLIGVAHLKRMLTFWYKYTMTGRRSESSQVVRWREINSDIILFDSHTEEMNNTKSVWERQGGIVCIKKMENKGLSYCSWRNKWHNTVVMCGSSGAIISHTHNISHAYLFGDITVHYNHAAWSLYLGHPLHFGGYITALSESNIHTHSVYTQNNNTL